MQFGSTQNDEDAVTLDELRGTTMDRQERATVEGLMLEVDLMKQKFEHMTENLNKLVGLVVTLQGRIEAINDARVRELQARGTGPTVVPDVNDRSSN